MNRWAIGIEYKGSGYHGWQSQSNNLPTVQAALEAVLSKVADHPVSVTCAGRTDKGVHAFGQVAHFDVPQPRPERAFVLGSNCALPPDISVKWAKQVSDDFHARFSANYRRYQYLIYNNGVRSALLADRATWVYRPLDANKMARAATALLGEHDFSGFRGPHCQAKSPVRTIHDISVAREADFIKIEITANAFLHHMVRNIVGVLLPIGYGQNDESYAKAVLQKKSRQFAGITAPAAGLYFNYVDYPEQFAIPNGCDKTKAYTVLDAHM